MSGSGTRLENPRARKTFPRFIPLSLLLALTSLLLFVWLADEVLEQSTRRFDEQVRVAVHGYSSPPLTAFMRLVTLLGSSEFLLPVVVVTLAVFLIRRQRRDAYLLTITMTGAVLLDVVLKLSFLRPRPEPYFNIPIPVSYAFPSGHALLSLCFYGLMAWLAAEWLQKLWWRVAVWVVAGLIISLIGLSRVYLGVHYPSDVLAGYLAATLWISAVVHVAKRPQ